MDDPQDLVSVYRAANPTEAHLLMNLLIDEDIDAQVSEENEPFAGLPIVPADVLVRKADETRARAIPETGGAAPAATGCRGNSHWG